MGPGPQLGRTFRLAAFGGLKPHFGIRPQFGRAATAFLAGTFFSRKKHHDPGKKLERTLAAFPAGTFSSAQNDVFPKKVTSTLEKKVLWEGSPGPETL